MKNPRVIFPLRWSVALSLINLGFNAVLDAAEQLAVLRSEFLNEHASDPSCHAPTIAETSSQGIVVSAGVVPHPVAVRYAWRNAPPATLFNLAGLPAAPFRSDTW